MENHFCEEEKKSLLLQQNIIFPKHQLLKNLRLEHPLRIEFIFILLEKRDTVAESKKLNFYIRFYHRCILIRVRALKTG